jgi:predicted secreted protein
MGGDSAAILYWHPRVLKPGETREVGFAYGLGSVTASGQGKLGLTLGGSFEPGQSFTLTAYVQNPTQGQTLTLEIPDGLERIEGDQTQNVPPAGGNATSIVTWKIKVQRTGDFTTQVRSSNGLVQAKTISISGAVAPPGRFVLEFPEGVPPNKDFPLLAKVTNAVEGQKLKLVLPEKGLNLSGGEREQAVAPLPADAKEKTRDVRWQLRLDSSASGGQLSIKVESSTGLQRTITLKVPQADPRIFGQ